MKHPDFNVIPVYRCEVINEDKIVFSCLMNSKAWSKTIENKIIWEYTENGRVVEHAVAGFVPMTEEIIIDNNKIILKLQNATKPVCEDKNMPLSEVLKAEGFYIPAIRPPTVPEGTSRLRLSLTADINICDVEKALNIIKTALEF